MIWYSTNTSDCLYGKLNDVEESPGPAMFDMIGPVTTVSVDKRYQGNEFSLVKMLVSNVLSCLIK